MPAEVLHLRCSPEEPGRARAFVSHCLDRSESATPDVRDDALLLVSELVTNVVKHGALPAKLTLTVETSRVRVLVQDSGSRIDGVRPTGAVERASGRGLFIVAAVATDWGIETVPDLPGKVVWFELATS